MTMPRSREFIVPSPSAAGTKRGARGHLWFGRVAVMSIAFGMPLLAAPAEAATARVSAGVTVGTAYPSVPPPEAVPEDRPVAPGRNYYWVPGHWNWTGRDWEWVSGYWAPPRAGYVYVAPLYVWEGGRWVYHRGYWRDARGHREYSYYGRVAVRPEWRARPRVDPRAWRAEHREMRQVAAERRAAQHHMAEHRESERTAAARRAATDRAAEHREAERIDARRRVAADRASERREAERIAAEQRAAKLHQVEHRQAERRDTERIERAK
jgi:hypothetical protein